MPTSSSNDTTSNDTTEHETRRLILQAAHRPFMEHGYRAVSTRQIAAACGITQPALYRHFATKQELYLAVLLETLQQTQTRIVRLVERRENVLHRLRLVARMLPSTWKDAGQMFHDIEHELDAQGRSAMSEAFMQLIVEPIASLFTEGIAQGILRGTEHGGLEPTEAVFVLFRLLNEQHAPETRSSIQNTDHMLDILLHGIAQPPNPEI